MDANLPVVNEVSDEELLDSPIKKLNPKQQRFVHLYLSGQHRITDIATLLNMSYSGVRKWLNTPEIRAIVEQYQQEEDEIVKQGLKALQMKAMYKMGDLIDSKMDAIAYQAARDVLDRGGKKAPTKNETTVEIYTFEQQMKDVIKQAGNIDDFIDVDFKETNE